MNRPSWKRVVLYGTAAMTLMGVGATLNSGSSPAPTHTRTVTHTVTKTEVPEVCLQALHDARPIALDAAKLAHITQGYIQLIPQAYAAGAESGVAGSSGGGVVSGIRSLNDQVTALNTTLTGHMVRFNSEASQCR